MTESAPLNGTTTPPASKMGNLALTEYSATPTSDDSKGPDSVPSWDIPDAFLLPNGYPDVSVFSSSQSRSPWSNVIAITSI